MQAPRVHLCRLVIDAAQYKPFECSQWEKRFVFNATQPTGMEKNLFFGISYQGIRTRDIDMLSIVCQACPPQETRRFSWCQLSHHERPAAATSPCNDRYRKYNITVGRCSLWYVHTFLSH